MDPQRRMHPPSQQQPASLEELRSAHLLLADEAGGFEEHENL
jgi:hypothetical protein